MLCESITIAQKFHPPFLGGNVEINSPLRRSEFRKSNKRAVRTLVTATVEFILILGFWPPLNTAGAYPSFRREKARREVGYNADHKLQEIACFEWNCGDSVT
jgi:hypothetical protein